MTHEELATLAYKELKDVANNGLPKGMTGNEVYSSFADYLFDFYPNLPWGSEENTKAIKQIMAEPDYKETMEKIQKRFDFDMNADFKEALCSKE